MTEIPTMIIIEDHPFMRDGLASYFNGTGRWQVMGTAADIDEAKKLFDNTQVDLLLLDLQLKDGWGLDIILHLNDLHLQKMPLLAVYSSFDDYAYVNAAMSMGVRVFICKRKSEKELEDALLQALSGKIVIDDEVQKKIQKTINICNLLTKREMEIINLVRNGISNKEIASSTGINIRTVENILYRIYEKTGINSRLELQKL